MVNRKRDQQKKLWLSKSEKDEADLIKKKLRLGDVDLYKSGVKSAKDEYEAFRERYQEQNRQFIKNELLAANRRGLSRDVMRRMYGDYEGDPLISERYGNLSFPITPSEAARMYHTISLAKWNALSESEKRDYISRTPDAWKELQRGPGRSDDVGYTPKTEKSEIGWDESRFKFGKKKAEG